MNDNQTGKCWIVCKPCEDKGYPTGMVFVSMKKAREYIEHANGGTSAPENPNALYLVQGYLEV
jgi:hypothetical protein